MDRFNEIIGKLPSERDNSKKIEYFDLLSHIGSQDDKKFSKLYRCCENILTGFGTIECKIACFQCLTVWVMLRIENPDFNPKMKLISDKLWTFFIDQLKNLSRIESIPLQLSILRFLYIMFSVESLSEEERVKRQEKTKYLKKDAIKQIEPLLFTILKTTENRVVYRCLCLYSLSLLCQLSFPSIKRDQTFFFRCLKFVLSKDPIFKRMDDTYDQFVLFGLCHTLLRRKKFVKMFNIKDVDDQMKNDMQYLIRECYLLTFLRNHTLRQEVLNNNLIAEMTDEKPRHVLFDILHTMVYFPERSVLLNETPTKKVRSVKSVKNEPEKNFTAMFSQEFFQPHLRGVQSTTNQEGEIFSDDEDEVHDNITKWKNLFSQTVYRITPDISKTDNLDTIVNIFTLLNHPNHHSAIWRSYYVRNKKTLKEMCGDPRLIKSICEEILKLAMNISLPTDENHPKDEETKSQRMKSLYQSFRILLLSIDYEDCRKVFFQFLSETLVSQFHIFRNFSRTDLRIFTKSSESKIFWDLKKEVLHSPHLKLQSGKNNNNNKRGGGKPTPYSLNADEWRVVGEKVQKMKKTTHKNVQMDKLRLICLRELYVIKERVIRRKLGEVYDKLHFILKSFICLCEEPLNMYQKKKKYRSNIARGRIVVVHHPSKTKEEKTETKGEEEEEQQQEQEQEVKKKQNKKKDQEHLCAGGVFSDVICDHAHLFIQVLSDHFKLADDVADLSWLAFQAFRTTLGLTMGQNTKHPPSSNRFLASQVSHATWRNAHTQNIKLDRTCLMPKCNNNVRFTTRVVFELRKYVKHCGQMTPQSFTSILPFLQGMINHKNMPKKKRKRRGQDDQQKSKKKSRNQYNESTFRVALNILCGHAGHPNVEAKDVLTEILLEVITHIPRLRDQAESTLHEVAKLYLPCDLTPLLRPDVLFSPFPSIRQALLKTLSFYPPLNSQKNDGLFMQRKALYFPSHKNIISTLWMTRYDSDEELAAIGKQLWDSYWKKIGQSSADEKEELEGEGEEEEEEEEEEEPTSTTPTTEEKEEEEIFKKDPVLCEKIEDEIFRFLRSKNEFLRNIASKALADAVIILAPEERMESLCNRLISSFPGITQTGRFSIIMTFTSLYPHFCCEKQVELFYKDFVLGVGLMDPTEGVRNEVVQCALDALRVHAKKYKSLVTDIFNQFLKEKGVKGEGLQRQQQGGGGSRNKNKKVNKLKKSDEDFIVGNVSTFLGFIAQYEEDDGRILKVMKQLVETLSIPSNRVQKSCMEALSSLVSTLCSRNIIQQQKLLQEKQEEEQIDLIPAASTFTLPQKVDELMISLMKDVTKGDYGVRRGRVYGITAIVKGAGVPTLRKYQVLKKLHDLAYSETDSDRETALIAYELFSCHLVPYFEAYLSQTVPPILFGLARGQPPHVLSQAERALTEVMTRGMSEFSVRLVTPKVLIQLSDENTFWRIKVGCCRLIGYMASVAPRQLDVTLPVIVNALMGCLSDVKPEVSESAFHALKRLGSVVKNRNILSILSDMLEALNNPTKKTMMAALKGILRTKFTHTLDAAAITLLVPVLARGMSDVNVKINLLSAKIIGMICGYLVKNYRILVPYVPKLLEGLRRKLIGPHPEVRATAAKAIGRIAKVMFSVDEEEKKLRKIASSGELSDEEEVETEISEEDDENEIIPTNLDPDLDEPVEVVEVTKKKGIMEQIMGETMDFIQSLMQGEDVNDIEREGAAMAISEIAASQGSEYVSHYLPNVYLPASQHAHPKVREGYLKLFTYLPILMSNDYEPFLKMTLTRTLQGLADADDACRETCYRGSSVMIRYFGIKFVELILPILLIGLQNEMWRTRLNCLKLLSNLLHNITIEESIKKKEEAAEEEEEEDGEDDDDDDDDTKLQPMDEEPILDLEALEKVLTKEITHQILSIIFLTQCDDNLTVRSKALFLWRSAIETNSDSVLTSILPSLLNIIIEHLSGESSSSDSRRRMAARACNVLVEKLGGKNIVGRLVPILSQRITEPKKETRVGVCVGISEIMKSSTTGTLKKYSKTLLRVVKVGICDAEKEVQVAASHAFNELSKVVGQKSVVNHIVKGLIYDLLSQEKENISTTTTTVTNNEEEEKEGEEEEQEQEQKGKKYNCLSGLSQLVKTNPKMILPVLIPSLLVEDMQDIHLLALGRIAKQSGHLFVDYYEEILRILFKLVHKAGVLDVTKLQDLDKQPLFFAISRFCQTAHVHKEALEILVDYLDQSLSQSHRGRARKAKSSPNLPDQQASLTFPVLPASIFLQVLIKCLAEHDPSKSSHFVTLKGRRVPKTPVMVLNKSLKFQMARTLLGSLMQFMNHEVEDVVICCSVTLKLLFGLLLDKEERILMLPTLRDHIQKYHQFLSEDRAFTKKKRKVVVSPVEKIKATSAFDLSSDYPIQLPKAHLSCFRVDIINATFLSLFEIGIMSKKSEPQEAAIYGLRYLIELTPPEILQKYVAKAAGRLVRIGGAKLRWQIKIVILETLVTLIHLGGKKILLYTSQLQTIFVKGLQSPTQLIRDQAARALGMLVSLGKARVKKLVKELHSAIKRFKPHALAYDLGTCSVCVGVMKGLEIVLIKQGEKVDPGLLKEVISTIVEKIFEEERISNMDILRWGSNVVGASLARVSGMGIKEEVLARKARTQLMVVRGALKHCPQRLEQEYVLDLLIKVAESTIADVKEQIQVQAIQLFLPYVMQFTNFDVQIDKKVMTSICNTCLSKLNVVRYHGFELVRNLAKKIRQEKEGQNTDEILFQFVEVVIKGSKDKHTPTKLVAEQAMYYLLKLESSGFETFSVFVKKHFEADEGEEKKKMLLRLCKKIKKRMSQQQDLLREEEEEEEEF